MDNRPPLVANQPEPRTYTAFYVLHDAEIGLVSDAIPVVCKPLRQAVANHSGPSEPEQWQDCLCFRVGEPTRMGLPIIRVVFRG